ncbi:hypothetical protein [Trichlorobacter lovleyi]|uniref:hypothetical protein n=1 Tax=Trichlorobacter lovleyi TaxID=313985 RepID=UPI0024802F76|nr:hypothetical protein [Trichlorobacter lovleyi]
MDYSEFERQINKAGLSIGEFADMIKMNRNSVTNYSSKEYVPTHLAVIAVLVGELKERNIEFRKLIESINIKPKKVRGAAAKGKFGGDKQELLF